MNRKIISSYCYCVSLYILVLKIHFSNPTIILAIMPKLRSTYDGRLIYKTSYEKRKAFLGTIHLQNHKIVWDSVRKLAYDVAKTNFSTL